MLTVVSPAKSLDFTTKTKTKKYSDPSFLSEAEQLVQGLQKLQPAQLSSLMDISEDLAVQNFERYAEWQRPFNLKNAKQAIFAFKGDVYLGLRAEQFGTADLNFAQKHLRILSGLYGVLRPLDLMQAYRLEMGRSFGINGSKNLYDFWGSKITDALNKALEKQTQKRKVLINLASNEYFNSVKPKLLDAAVITPQFKDWSGGQYRVLSFFAKKARGEMAAYIIKNRVNSPNKLKQFDVDGYCFDEEESNKTNFVFKRKQAK
ncbi:MAG: peroxide stress protein YaaA [Gammaproteobacteria bacterium]|nr:peroxide stress protein YaaA [Gammaproteobacteria bacterium]MDD9895760.1 peroxide stress protein YaaA [Gammaproteobacteria bacterium]MDD9959207.1 peroxide stress protein YaaA [Gammaproteobacteria bacterium]